MNIKWRTFLSVLLTILLIYLPSISYTEEKKSPLLDNEEIELILQTQVNNLLLGDEFSISRGNITYIGIQNLFSLLNFAITVNIKNKSADGWFIKEDQSFIMKKNTNSTQIKVKGEVNYIKESEIIYKEDDIYIAAEIIFKIININYKINTRTLTLRLFPTSPLPIQEKLARKKREKPRVRSLTTKLPQNETPYSLWSIPFIDVQTRYTGNSSGYDNSTYSILSAGDLAYMTGTYYLQGNESDNLRYLRVKLARDSLTNDLLGPLKATHFSFGEINPNIGGGVGSAGQEVGARISNKPFGRNTRLQQTDFIGDTQPTWDVEIYRNNIYLEGQTVGNNGRYEFYNQDILPGENTFKLVFYGPEGQQYEKIEKINIENGDLTAGKTFYDISLSRQYSSLFELRDNIKAKTRNERRFNVSLFRDLNQYISLQSTYSRYSFSNGEKHNFIKPAIRIFALNTLLFSNMTKDINGGYSTYYSLSKSLWKQAFVYSHSQQAANFQIDSSSALLPKTVTRNISLSGPLIAARLLKINYALTLNKQKTLKVGNRDQYRADFNVSAFNFSVSNNLTYTETSSFHSIKNKIITGSTNITRSIYRFNIRGGSNYQLEPVKSIKPKQITTLFGNISWIMFSKLRLQYGYNYSPLNRTSSHSIRLHLRTNKFSIVSNYTRSNNGSYSIYAGINFSLSYDKNSSTLKIGSERTSRTGGVSAKIYIDENNNGIHDFNEPLIKDAKINAEQARRNGKSNEKGIVFLPGLPIDRRTDVELDISSLQDPFLVPSISGYSFTPRPGVIKKLNIPLVTSGEIEGTINIKNKDGSTRTVGYAPLVLTNTQTREIRQVISAYDGFYLFSSVPPGKYLVTIDRSYLNRNKLGAKKPMPRVVTIYSTGNVDMGNDFTIYPLRPLDNNHSK